MDAVTTTRAGRIQFIDPRQTEILGRPCFAAFADVDEAPDLAVLGVGP
ncbi:hypothetical protein [Mesorhizobium sp. M0208]